MRPNSQKTLMEERILFLRQVTEPAMFRRTNFSQIAQRRTSHTCAKRPLMRSSRQMENPLCPEVDDFRVAKHEPASAPVTLNDRLQGGARTKPTLMHRQSMRNKPSAHERTCRKDALIRRQGPLNKPAAVLDEHQLVREIPFPKDNK